MGFRLTFPFPLLYIVGMNWIYTRRSTNRQSDVSLELQEETCRRWVEEPITVIHETGSGADNTRPQLNYMLANLQPQDNVCIYDNSRLARNLIDSISILKEINDKGAVLICDSKRIDPENPQDLFTFNVHSAFSDYQLLIQRQKSREGLKRRIENGDAVFAGDTFGYSLTKHGKTTTAAIIEEEAEVIRYVYESYAKGKAMKEIEREMWGKVFQRPFQMNIQNIRPMLQRVIYMGYYLDTAKMQKHIQRYTENEIREHLVKSNIYPPIIQEDLWWEVFHKLRTFRVAHAVPYRNRFTKHTLSGVFKCSACGKGISFKNRRRDGKNFEQYVFHSHTPDCPFMKRTQFDAEWLEQIVRACFILTFLDGSRVGLFFKEEKERYNTNSKELKDEISTINKEIKKNETKKGRIIDAISDGLIDMNDCKSKLEKLKTEYDSLKQRKTSLENQLSTLEGDVDDMLKMSAQEVLDNFWGHERDYYLKFMKSGLNYHKYLSMEMMNGTRYEIYKPRRTNHSTKPAKVEVFTKDEYFFNFTFLPTMEIGEIYSTGNVYLQNTLTKWKNMVNRELKQEEGILLS